MKASPEYLRKMSRVVSPAPTSEDAAERRRRMVAGIQVAKGRVEQTVAQRRRIRRIGAVLSGVAAAAAVLLALQFSRDATETASTPPAVAALEKPSLSSPNQEGGAKEATRVELTSGALRGVDSGARMLPHQRVETTRYQVESDAAALSLLTRATLHAWRDAEFQIVEHETPGRREDVSLSSGKVALQVPPLPAGQRLTVTTEEAVVEVRGTEFQVERRRTEEGTMGTWVSVIEGKVSVTSSAGEVFLGPGEKWTSIESPSLSGDQRKAPEPSLLPSGRTRGLQKEESAPSAVATAPLETESADNNAADASAPSPVSDLAEQNRLYQAALLASRNGFPKLARVRFEELLSRYPRSPLAPGARRELHRLEQEKE